MEESSSFFQKKNKEWGKNVEKESSETIRVREMRRKVKEMVGGISFKNFFSQKAHCFGQLTVFIGFFLRGFLVFHNIKIVFKSYL